MTDTGHIGEAIAAKYYQQRGWLLLNHNYRTRMGEIDLVLYKEQRLILAAQQYLQCSPYRDAAIRFDVVEVTPAAKGWQVHCIPSAFEC